MGNPFQSKPVVLQIAEQLACFEKGFPFLKLDAAASVEKGIMAPAENEMKNYLEAWDTYKEGEKTIVKFVPASGAASRMFKNLFEFLGADYNIPKTDFEKKFFDHIHSFAFYNDLNAACMDNTGKDSEFSGSTGKLSAIKVKNLTRFAILSNFDYENATVTSISSEILSSSITQSLLDPIAVGNIIAFRTGSSSTAGGGRIGVMKVINITEPKDLVSNNATARVMTVEIKFPQKK